MSDAAKSSIRTGAMVATVCALLPLIFWVLSGAQAVGQVQKQLSYQERRVQMREDALQRIDQRLSRIEGKLER